MSKMISALSMLLIFCLLAGCNETPQLTDTIQTDNPIPQTEGFIELVDPEDFEVEYPAELNYIFYDEEPLRSITISEKADSFICCDFISLTGYLAVMDSSDGLIAVNHEDIKGSLLSKLFPEIDALPSIVSNGLVDEEKLKELDADVIFFADEWAAPVADRLYQEGFPVVINSCCGEWSSAGRNTVTNTEIAANRLSREYVFVNDNETDIQHAGILLQKEYIAQCMKSLPFSEWKTVLFLGDSLRSVYSSPVVDQIIEGSCGINVATDVEITTGYPVSRSVQGNRLGPGTLSSRFTPVSLEEILQWNPEVIWIPWFADYTVSDVLNDPALSDISAVKNKNVYAFPGSLEPWYYATSAMNIGIAWGAYNLHPDRYTYDDLISFADRYYQSLYGVSFTEEEMGLK